MRRIILTTCIILWCGGCCSDKCSSGIYTLLNKDKRIDSRLFLDDNNGVAGSSTQEIVVDGIRFCIWSKTKSSVGEHYIIVKSSNTEAQIYGPFLYEQIKDLLVHEPVKK